jgi:hypothetical protein
MDTPPQYIGAEGFSTDELLLYTLGMAPTEEHRKRIEDARKTDPAVKEYLDEMDPDLHLQSPPANP